MTEVGAAEMRRIIRIFLTSEEPLRNFSEFSDRLEIPSSEGAQYRREFNLGIGTFYDLLHRTLQSWRGRNYSKGATVERLLVILMEMNLFQLAEQVTAEFGITKFSSGPIDRESTSQAAGAPPPLHSSIIQRDIRILHQIDMGQYGKVFRVKSSDNNCYALKQIPLAKCILHSAIQQDPAEYIKRLLREVDALHKINSTHVVRYYDSWFDGPLSHSIQNCLQNHEPLTQMQYKRDSNGNPITGEDEEKTCLFIRMEYCDVNLQQWMADNPIPDRFSNVSKIIKQILVGLSAVHKHGIIHRDLKPNNILLTMKAEGDFIVKIADFGVARDINTNSSLTGNVGCNNFRSPEMVDLTKTVYDFKTDIWSLGIIYLHLLHTFKTTLHETHALSSIALGRSEIFEELEFANSNIHGFSGRLQQLKCMLSVDPVKRPSADELLLRMLS